MSSDVFWKSPPWRHLNAVPQVNCSTRLVHWQQNSCRRRLSVCAEQTALSSRAPSDAPNDDDSVALPEFAAARRPCSKRSISTGLPAWWTDRQTDRRTHDRCIDSAPRTNADMPMAFCIRRYVNKCKKLNSLKHPVRTTVAGSHN